MLVTIDILAGL